MKSISLLLFLISFQLLQAETYLQIKYEGKDVSYPPGTKFELYNNSGELIFTQSDLPEKFSFNTQHKLILHPTYKSEEDVYMLDEATLITRLHDYNYSYSPTRYYYSNPTAATKVVSKSSEKENKYNLTLTFENGLIFNYRDGITQAFFKGKELKIINNYIVDSEIGRYKISFRASTGETWWVFEAKK